MAKETSRSGLGYEAPARGRHYDALPAILVLPMPSQASPVGIHHCPSRRDSGSPGRGLGRAQTCMPPLRDNSLGRGEGGKENRQVEAGRRQTKGWHLRSALKTSSLAPSPGLGTQPLTASLTPTSNRSGATGTHISSWCPHLFRKEIWTRGMSRFPTNHLSAWGRGNSLGPQFSALQKWSPRKVQGEQRRSVGLEAQVQAKELLGGR